MIAVTVIYRFPGRTITVITARGRLTKVTRIASLRGRRAAGLTLSKVMIRGTPFA